MEISHHDGINNFNKVGCYLFNIINKEYAKKLIVMLPNQKHHYIFIKKIRKFYNFTWSLKLIDNKRSYKLNPGDVVHLRKTLSIDLLQVQRMYFEEIYSTSIADDSFLL